MNEALLSVFLCRLCTCTVGVQRIWGEEEEAEYEERRYLTVCEIQGVGGGGHPQLTNETLESIKAKF